MLISHTYVVALNQQKVEALAQEGIEIHLMAPESWRETMGVIRLERLRASSFALISSRVLFSGNGKRYLYPPAAFLKILGQLRPDLVQVEEEPDSFALLEASLAKRLFGYKLVSFTWENLYRPHLLWSLGRMNLARADGAIVGNGGAKEVLHHRGFHRPIMVLPQLGVDASLFQRRPAQELRRRLGLKGFTIGYLGRLVEEKGLLTLLEAAANLKGEFHLLLVGAGPLKERLLTHAQELGLGDRLLLLAAVPHADVPAYINCMDALVLPSQRTPRWQEQFGHVLIEAMACQVPVVGSNSGAIPEVIGDAGVLFAEGDAHQLHQRLEELMQDDALRERLGREGRKRVLTNYTHRAIARQTVRFWREILGCAS